MGPRRSLYLLYHELRPVKSRYSYVTPCEEFAAHCALAARLQRAPSEEVLRPEITFDDGHASDARYALPILAQHGLVATFFITAGWTERREGFMRWCEIRELLAAGHRIGAHGMGHKLLTGCSAAELDEELRGARQRLEDGLGTEVSTMSLPGGRANGRVLKACREAGFRQVFTSAPRAEVVGSGSFTVGRLNLHGGTSTAWLEEVLRPATGTLGRVQRVDWAKGFAKRCLGDRLYAALWAMANRQEPEAGETEAPVL